jgi:hypothetical protein
MPGDQEEGSKRSTRTGSKALTLMLSSVYYSLGRSNALKLREECLEIRKRVIRAEPPDLLWSMKNLAAIYNFGVNWLQQTISSDKQRKDSSEIEKRQ